MATYYDVGDGRPFATIQDAIDAIPGALGGTGEHMVRVYAGGTEVGDMYRYDENPDANTGFAGETVTDFISLYAMVPHFGQRNAGIVVNGQDLAPATTMVFQLNNYAVLHGFGITCDVATSSLRGIRSMDTHSFIENCVIFDLESTVITVGIYISNSPSVHYVRNCMLMDFNCSNAGNNTYGISVGGNFGVHNIYNCSIHNMRHTGGANAYGINSLNTITTITNCVIGTTANDNIIRTIQNPTVTYTITSDATANSWGVGAGNQINQDPDADVRFVNTGIGGEDLHIQAGSCAIDAGIAIAGFNDDIDGGIRPHGSAWDIGADEYGARGLTYYDGLTPDLNWISIDEMFSSLNPKVVPLETEDLQSTTEVRGKYRRRHNISMDVGGYFRKPRSDKLGNVKDGHWYKYSIPNEGREYTGNVFMLGNTKSEYEKKRSRSRLDRNSRLDR